MNTDFALIEKKTVSYVIAFNYHLPPRLPDLTPLDILPDALITHDSEETMPISSSISLKEHDYLQHTKTTISANMKPIAQQKDVIPYTRVVICTLLQDPRTPEVWNSEHNVLSPYWFW